jgi:hypothetical protein
MEQQVLKLCSLAPGVLPVNGLYLRPGTVQSPPTSSQPVSPDPELPWETALQQDEWAQQVIKALNSGQCSFPKLQLVDCR